MEKIFYNNSESLLRILVVGIVAYTGLVVLLRASGKRTLSKMNAFDFIVTVALGSTLATVMLNKSIALADGLLAFFLLIFLQYAITWLSVRYRPVSNLVKSTPTLLVYRGQMLRSMMRRERIDEDELVAVVRQNGLLSLEAAGAIVLETDGSLTLLKDVAGVDADALRQLRKPEGLEGKGAHPAPGERNGPQGQGDTGN